MFKKTYTRKIGRTLLCTLLCVLLASSMLFFASAEGADLTVLGDGVADSWIGDASPDECEVKIVGMLGEPGFFTTSGLVEFAIDEAQTSEYGWKNSSGSTDRDTFTGICIEDLLGLLDVSEKASSIIVTASDGFSRSFRLDDSEGGAFWTDIDGNKMMLAWNGTASRTNRDIVDFDLPRAVIGQKDPDDVNRSGWVNDIVEIRVTAFGDLSGFDWAATAIEAMYEAGIVTGMPGGLFEPASPMNRAMAVTILGRILNPDKDKPDVDPIVFPDVDYDDYYGVYVSWAVDNKIVQGYEDGTFRPGVNISLPHLILLAQNAGLKEVPAGIEQGVERLANRAELVFIMYALLLQPR